MITGHIKLQHPTNPFMTKDVPAVDAESYNKLQLEYDALLKSHINSNERWYAQVKRYQRALGYARRIIKHRLVFDAREYCTRIGRIVRGRR